eukprot:45957_1
MAQSKLKAALSAAILADIVKKVPHVDCPDIHLPKTQYIAADNGDDLESKDNEKQIQMEQISHAVRIIHISDTHLKHLAFQKSIPSGEILIHSGDFVSKKFGKWTPDGKAYIRNNIGNIKPKELQPHMPRKIIEFNEWLGTMPHKYKIVIAGNHEICFNELSADFIQENILTNCIYLQDSWVQLYGLKIYGTPWTTCSRTMAFSYGGSKKFLYSKWEAIPSDTDIVVSHLPPLGIFDLAWGAKYDFSDACKVCGDTHKKYKHWGCATLKKNIVERIKPKLHLFGHVHDDTGFQMDKQSNVLFINSAMDLAHRSHRVKLVFDL